jgi:antitoxin YefM
VIGALGQEALELSHAPAGRHPVSSRVFSPSASQARTTRRERSPGREIAPAPGSAASEARKGLFPLIKKVIEDHDAIEIVSRHGNAVLISAEDYAALREGAYLLRSPANARRLLKAYENALNGVHIAERSLIDPDAADGRQHRR